MRETELAERPFRIENPYPRGLGRAVVGMLQPALEKTLALYALNRLYGRILRIPGDRHFVEKALDAMHVTWDVSEDDLSRLPAEGPLVVVSNHPFGGLEGLVLESLLHRVRPDVKLLANYLLHVIPDLRDSFLFVDPFGKGDAVRRNLASIRSAIAWVKGGHALGVFPAGEVSHLKLGRPGVADPPWLPTAARIVQITGAAVVPVYFEGRNSDLFQLLGLLHPRLRTALLPRELLNKQHTRVSVRVGRRLGPEKLLRIQDADELTSYLRVRTYILRKHISENDLHQDDSRQAPCPKSMAPIVPPVPTAELARQVEALPDHQHLLDSGEFAVYASRFRQAPDLMREIGRLREVSFRAVGEGTGMALDLDRFDETYVHLFVWNRRKQELVGAYRAGPTDEILPAHGLRGLYTSTLFKYKPALLKQLGPALEMGRSFVRPEYQRNHSPLSLLWRGIGRYVAMNPRYRMLFGPVSISQEYHSVSRQLLVAFLRQNCCMANLAELIKPKTPPRLAPIRDWSPAATSVVVRNLEEVDELIAEIEADMKSVPVLLRQYLRLNAMLLGFNMDPDFGDVLDALMLTDLTRISRAILVRYMGKEDTAAFLSYHGMRLSDPIKDVAEGASAPEGAKHVR